MSLKGSLLQNFRLFLVRLPRNLVSNRFFVLAGGTVFLYSHSRTKTLASNLSLSHDETGSRRLAVFVRTSRLLSRRFPPPPHQQSLYIPHLGRFGNAVRELVSAIAAASQLNIGYVFLHGDNVFCLKSEFPRPGVHRRDQSPVVLIDRKLPPGRKAKIYELLSLDRGVLPLEPAETSKAWDFAASFLNLNNHPVERATTENSLVIHVRGGDIFSDRQVPAYGQPPLSFYRAVLNHRAWSEAVIVHQDTRNPVLAPLFSECESLGIPYSAVSGTLSSDIDVLLRAQNLVAGRGTFIPAVAGLSKNLKNVYYFEDKFVVTPPRKGFTAWRAIDKGGEYRKRILQDNWENSREQKDLMLSYPAEHIRVVKLSSRG